MRWHNKTKQKKDFKLLKYFFANLNQVSVLKEYLSRIHTFRDHFHSAGFNQNFYECSVVRHIIACECIQKNVQVIQLNLTIKSNLASTQSDVEDMKRTCQTIFSQFPITNHQ